MRGHWEGVDSVAMEAPVPKEMWEESEAWHQGAKLESLRRGQERLWVKMQPNCCANPNILETPIPWTTSKDSNSRGGVPTWATRVVHVIEGRVGGAPLGSSLGPTGLWVGPRCEELNFFTPSNLGFALIWLWWCPDSSLLEYEIMQLVYFKFYWIPQLGYFGLLERLCNFREALNFEETFFGKTSYRHQGTPSVT